MKMTGTERVVLALTNGGNDKPYWKWIKGGKVIGVYVADEQLMCEIPIFEGCGELADAICLAGGIITALDAEREYLKSRVKQYRTFFQNTKITGIK
jgi:hypothetical protein